MRGVEPTGQVARRAEDHAGVRDLARVRLGAVGIARGLRRAAADLR